MSTQIHTEVRHSLRPPLETSTPGYYVIHTHILREVPYLLQSIQGFARAIGGILLPKAFPAALATLRTNDDFPFALESAHSSESCSPLMVSARRSENGIGRGNIRTDSRGTRWRKKEER